MLSSPLSPVCGSFLPIAADTGDCHWSLLVVVWARFLDNNNTQDWWELLVREPCSDSPDPILTLAHRLPAVRDRGSLDRTTQLISSIRYGIISPLHPGEDGQPVRQIERAASHPSIHWARRVVEAVVGDYAERRHASCKTTGGISVAACS